MTSKQFKQAFQIANNNDIELMGDLSQFNGYALSDFKPVHATINQVAWLIRWQAQYLSGGWDMEELERIAKVGRTKFIILD